MNIKTNTPIFPETDTSNYLQCAMPKAPETKRVEIHLLPEIVEQLKALADKENRSLKNYIETLLQKHVKEQKGSKRQ